MTQPSGTGSLEPDKLSEPKAETPASLSSPWQRVAMLAFLLALGAWALHDVAWVRLWGLVAEASPGWIALAAIVNLTVMALRAARWLALVRPVSKKATFAHAFEALLVGQAFSTVLPARAGELVRARLFNQRTGLALPAIATTIGLDFLVNAAGLVLGAALLPLLIDVPDWIRPGAIGTVVVCVLGFVVTLALRPRAKGPTAGPRGVFAVAREGLGAMSHPRALGVSLSACLVAWALEVVMTAWSMTAVGIHLPLSAVCVVLLAVNLALAIPLQPPGGFGTIEAGAIVALTSLGIAKDQALVFGVVYHLLQAVPLGILGFALWGRAQLRP